MGKEKQKPTTGTRESNPLHCMDSCEQLDVYPAPGLCNPAIAQALQRVSSDLPKIKEIKDRKLSNLKTSTKHAQLGFDLRAISIHQQSLEDTLMVRWAGFDLERYFYTSRVT